MNNLEEKLAIMQELYKMGIEPAMWKCNYSNAFSYNKEIDTLTRQPMGLDTAKLQCTIPWFPLEQVLELLPEKIQVLETMTLMPSMQDRELLITKDTIGYGEVDDYCILFDEEKDIDNDIHLAALKLLKEIKQ